MNVYYEIVTGSSATVVAIRCEKCNSSDVISWERQTRSSDEPVSIFHKCKKCRYVSIDHGS